MFHYIKRFSKIHFLSGVRLLAILGLAVLAMGFWFHTDDQAIFLGKYSLKTLLLNSLFSLVVLAMGLVIGLVRSKRFWFPCFAVLLVLAAVVPYLFIFTYLRYLQRKIFIPTTPHPYLQIDLSRQELARVQGVPKSGVRIFCLGGSTTEQEWLLPGKRYPAILERKLRERFPHRTIEVVNLARQWYTTQHTLLNLQINVYPCQPDLILLFHAINDLYQSFLSDRFAIADAFRSDYSHLGGPLIRILRPEDNYPLFHLLRHRWYSDRHYRPLREISVSSFRSLQCFTRNLELIIDFCQQKQIPLLLASQPYLYKADLSATEKAKIIFPQKFCCENRAYPDIASMMRGMQLFNETTSQLAQRRGVAYLDLERSLPKTLEFFIDDVHCTGQGADRLAESFFRKIVEENFLSGQ